MANGFDRKKGKYTIVYEKSQRVKIKQNNEDVKDWWLCLCMQLMTTVKMTDC